MRGLEWPTYDASARQPHEEISTTHTLSFQIPRLLKAEHDEQISPSPPNSWSLRARERQALGHSQQARVEASNDPAQKTQPDEMKGFTQRPCSWNPPKHFHGGPLEPGFFQTDAYD
jgi:hypothetical protein